MRGEIKMVRCVGCDKFYDLSQFDCCPHCGDKNIHRKMDSEERIITHIVNEEPKKKEMSESDKKKLENEKIPQSVIDEVYLSYGNFPIHNVTISGNKMFYKNTIHGSRDGGLKYADNFFEEKEIRLNKMQRERLNVILQNLELEKGSLDDKKILYLGEQPKEKFQVFTFNETYFDIKNPRILIDFCEELCNFIPYEANYVPVSSGRSDLTKNHSESNKKGLLKKIAKKIMRT